MTPPDLRVNSMVAGLGPGVLGASAPAVQLVLQGCTIGCPGCTSPHTHAAGGGRQMPQAALLQVLQGLHQRGQLARLTVTGGEPTEQAGPLQTFLGRVRERFSDTEVVLYSGRTWAALQRHFHGLVAQCDVVVAGPFVANRPPTPLAGSDNQTVHLLTPRAERLYRDWPQWPLHRVQVNVAETPGHEQRMVLVGIPQRALAPALAQRRAAPDGASPATPITTETPR